MATWIKIDREIKEHWIFSNAEYLRAWLLILICVNYDDKEAIIHGEKIMCKRGQSLYSLQTWSLIFGLSWTVQKVRTFFELLKKDGMITTEGLRKTTRLSVCNYELYQQRTTDKKQPENRQKTTTKESKEYKELLIHNYTDKSVYKFCSDIYNDFCLSQTGTNAIFDSLAGRSLLSILVYISKNSKERTPEKLKNGFKYIFDNYNKWSKFNQGNIKLNQISSNLINIIKDIKENKEVRE